MAPTKRNRPPTRITSNKRPRYIQPDTDSTSTTSSPSSPSSSSSPSSGGGGSIGGSASDSDKDEASNNSEEEWEATRILAQRGQGFGFEYLIEWKGIDFSTGKPWEPSWERANYASETLRKSWEEEKARLARERNETTATAKEPRQRGRPRKEKARLAQEKDETTGTTEQPRPRGRPKKVKPALAAQNRGVRRRPIVEISESSSESELDLPTKAASIAANTSGSASIDLDASWTSPRVNIDARSESSSHFEVPESTGESPTEATDLNSSELFVSQPAFRASGVVLNTQSSAGDVSYIPVTQEELESSLHSYTDHGSEGHVASYLLSGPVDADVASTLGARAHSPATSVAETVADTTQDLHSLRQSESQYEQSKATDNTETPASTEPIAPPLQDKSPYDSWSDPDAAELDHEAEPFIQFVENTTRFDEQSIRQSPASKKHSTGLPALAEEPSEVADFNTQPVVDLAESELLAVAETPQLTRILHIVQEAVSQDGQQDCAHALESTQPSLEDEPEVSLTELSVSEENAQFPFHSQHPTSFDPRSVTKPDRRASTGPPYPLNTPRVEDSRLSESPTPNTRRGSSALNNSEESTTIDEISQSDQSSRAKELSTQGCRDSVNHGRFAADLQPAVSSNQSTGSREHNAQLIPSSFFKDTQEAASESIQDFVQADLENPFGSRCSSPCSRHDSSQETPERQLQSVEHASSPIPHPPSYSLRTCDSNVPPRPSTPTPTSSSFKMTGSTGESTEEWARRMLREKQEAALAVARSKRQDMSAEGTRSPSTVPDRAPVPPAQTSLRSVAFANAKDQATETLSENPLAATSTTTDAGPSKEKAEVVAAVAAAAAVAPPVPGSFPKELADDATENMSDVDQDLDLDDYENDYDDDLDLEQGEYIVPLFIEGRQRDTYIKFLGQKTDIILKALHDKVANLTPELTDEVDRILKHSKDIETHPDLTYAEAESAMGLDLQMAEDIQPAAQFGIDNSVKFKFLGVLFNQLRKHELHAVLLLDHGNVALSNILHTFLQAAGHNFSLLNPRHDSKASSDALKITVFPSTTSPVIRPVDLIICLDVVQNAAKIRQNNWATAGGRNAPVLHLVIPHSVGHIERYLRENSTKERRTEMILVGLNQFQDRHEIGNRIDIDTPDAVQSAKLIASWLTPDDEQETPEWPLPSIGSLVDYLEVQGTQQSVKTMASSPVPERAKRSLETEDSETVKRLRYTPQPRTVPISSAVHGSDMIRVSDSVPESTATENAQLRTQLEKLVAEHRDLWKQYQDERETWSEQQTQHENREEQHRKLLRDKTDLKRALEVMTTKYDKARAQVEAQAVEKRGLIEELNAQRDLGLASDNDKDVEITRLRKEIEAAILERTKAQNSAKTSETNLEYTKDRYHIVINEAGQLKTDLTALQTQNEKLAKQASGEAARVKKLHLDISAKNMMQQINGLKNENANLKGMLRQREEDLLRAKNNSGRAAYGTRGQSTTPQPKTRSRAASPERGSNAPRGRGRISNLVAEER